MKSICRGSWTSIAVFFALITIHLPVPAYAGEAVFTRDYTYNASEADSKLTSRAIAMEQVKRVLLEELGTYIKSETVIKNSDLTRDEVTVLTAGVVSTEILNEKWDGETYYIKVEIKADPDRIAESIAELVKEQEDLDDLRDSKAEADEALREVERLRAELAATRAELEKARSSGEDVEVASKRATELQKEYRESAAQMSALDLWDKANAQFNRKQYDKALENVDLALKADPSMARAYGLRGAILNRSKKYEEAAESFSRGIELKPDSGKLYFGRSYAYQKLNQKKEARADLKKSSELGFDKARRKLDKGSPYQFR